MKTYDLILRNTTSIEIIFSTIVFFSFLGSESRRKKKHKTKKPEVISPFSQQMSKDPFQFNQPFGGSSTSNMAAIGDDYESKVRLLFKIITFTSY